MGFFAVVDPLGGPTWNKASGLDFEVERLDVNVWVLPLVAGRHLALCDVGVRVHAGATGVSCFDIAVPFRTDSDSLSDLSEEIGNHEVAALVFGESVVDEFRNVRDLTSDYALAHPIDAASSERSDNLSNDGFSLWRIQLADELGAGECGYYRFRLEARSFGRTIVWRRSSARIVGALVDLHFYDFREAALVPQSGRYDRNLKPVRRLNAFLIVHSSFRLRKTSPELRYLRLLEGRKWERYLHRATDLRRRGKFLVHYWRSENVGTGHEFRAFLDLGKRTESLGWTTALGLVALTTLGVVLTSSPEEIGDSYLGGWAESLWTTLSNSALAQLGVLGTSVLVLLVLAGDVVTYLRPTRRFIQDRFRRAERWLYRKRADY